MDNFYQPHSMMPRYWWERVDFILLVSKSFRSKMMLVPPELFSLWWPISRHNKCINFHETQSKDETNSFHRIWSFRYLWTLRALRRPLLVWGLRSPLIREVFTKDFHQIEDRSLPDQPNKVLCQHYQSQHHLKQVLGQLCHCWPLCYFHCWRCS